MVGWHACSRVLGKGGIGSGVQRRAGVGAEQRGSARVHAGTSRTLWARWAARRHHVGMGGQRCTVTLERSWPGELVRWVETVLAAR
jgi:hypothetical protein